MAEYIKVSEGLESLNEFLLSSVERISYASKARKQYYKHTTFGSCPHETFKSISIFIDNLIRKANL